MTPAPHGTAITTEAELRLLVGHPQPVMRDKAIPLIDEESRRFLEAATFFLLATTAADGTVDVSPRGEPAGGVIVLGRRTLAFVDRPGNRRLDSFRNILQRPDVGLLFIVPGVGETLRVNGRATLVRHAPFLEPVAGAALGVVVEVDELFLQTVPGEGPFDGSATPATSNSGSGAATCAATPSARCGRCCADPARIRLLSPTSHSLTLP